MTKDAVWDTHNVIRLAREADWPDSMIHPIIMAKLADFAKLVAENAISDEREACAKLVEVSDDIEDWELVCGSDGRELLNAMADVIRARGSKE